MGGFFGAIAKRDVALDVFFGTDYHSQQVETILEELMRQNI